MNWGEDNNSPWIKEAMFQKIRLLFSLESRLAGSLQASSQDSVVRFTNVEKEFLALRAQLDKLEMQVGERMSKIESLFAEEIEAKVAVRDALVKAKRLEARK